MVDKHNPAENMKFLRSILEDLEEIPKNPDLSKDFMLIPWPRMLLTPEQKSELTIWIPLMEALQVILFNEVCREIKNALHPRNKSRIQACINFAISFIWKKQLSPENAADYVIRTFRIESRNTKRKKPFNFDKILTKEDFLVSEIAAITGKTSRTIQRWIKNKELKQKLPHSKITRDDLKKYAGKYDHFLLLDLENAENTEAEKLKDKP